jgi:outer membrane protein assembly factor BamB
MNILFSANLKKTIVAVVLMLLMVSTAFAVQSPAKANSSNVVAFGGAPANAPNGATPLPSGVTANYVVSPNAYLSFSPNPIGVGQELLVNIWVDPGPSYARYFPNYIVDVKKPDGTTDTVTLNSYAADGTSWFNYIVDQVGTWQFKFDFPGGYFPPGNYTVPPGVNEAGYTETYTKSVSYTPTSTNWQNLTVQSAMIASWNENPSPSGYWTRPVQPDNREWSSVIGDFPWYGPATQTNYPADTNRYWSSVYNFIPYVQAPNSAHIVWMKLGAIGGLMGGDMGTFSPTANPGTPTIIYEGRCYQTITRPLNGVSQTVWECYDLRTGQIYWDETGLAGYIPTVIEYDNSGLPAVEGAGSNAAVTVSLVSLSNNRLIKYNPFTGAATVNMSIPTFSSITNNATSTTTVNQYYMNGYVLSVQILDPTTYNYRLINWTTFGSSTAWASRVISNISFPFNSLGQFQDTSTGTAFIIREPDALDSSGISPIAAFPFVNLNIDNATGIRYGCRIVAASLVTGKLLFNTTLSDQPIVADQAPYSQSCNIADHGVLAVLMRHGYFDFFSEQTGQLLYKSDVMTYPWDQDSFGAYAIQSAYGLLYREGYSGIYAFNWTTGKIVWKFEAPASPFETPYTDANGTTVYSWYSSGELADGKLFSYNSEHTPSEPLTRGWGLYCINATTGQGIWNITGSMTPGAVSDGYLTASNAYDGYTYAFGTGQSTTTVSAPQTQITVGQNAIISGTVLDQSPAQPGTPCVSDSSMGPWMAYLHMQTTVPTNVQGVPVSIDAVDPNGNPVHLGDTTSDMSGTFAFTWTPNMAGNYKLTATFPGSSSYGSSYGETHANVVNAAAATATPTTTSAKGQTTTDALMTTNVVGIILIIIAIAIVGLLLLRKK